jgi:hypothetical protein
MLVILGDLIIIESLFFVGLHHNEAGINCLIYNIDKKSKAYRGMFPFQVLQAVNDKDPGV